MASSVINSDDGVVSGTSGLKSSGGDDGVLVFQSKGTETARINTDKQIVAAAGTASLPALTTTGDLNTGIFFPAADTIAFAEGGVEAMRIDSSGNVGIGTTSPSGKLNLSDGTSCQLNINSAAAGATRQVLFSTSTNTQEALISSNNATGELKFESGRSGTAAYFQTFYTNNAERARIDSSGNLNVGRTVATTSNTVGCSVLGVGAIIAERDNDICMSLNRLNGNGIGVLFSRGAGNDVGNITLNTSTTTYNTSSDYRLKENIAPMTGALEKVAQLKPVTYTWKVDGSAGQGFIAHELAEVVPDCVSGEKDAVETYTDEDGNEQTRIKPQGIDTSFLVATLTAAIQELSAKNDALEARIAALEAVPGNE
jgi:hypothetical protein